MPDLTPHADRRATLPPKTTTIAWLADKFTLDSLGNVCFNWSVTDIRAVCLNRTSNRQSKLATQLHNILSRLLGRFSTRISVTRVLARGAAYMRLRRV